MTANVIAQEQVSVLTKQENGNFAYESVMKERVAKSEKVSVSANGLNYTLPTDVKAFGVSGHAHYLAREMKMTATLPDGKTKTLLWIPDWDFSWQGQYMYQDYVALPKGTKLHTQIRYDNSAGNPRNPTSPPQAWSRKA